MRQLRSRNSSALENGVEIKTEKNNDINSIKVDENKGKIELNGVKIRSSPRLSTGLSDISVNSVNNHSNGENKSNGNNKSNGIKESKSPKQETITRRLRRRDDGLVYNNSLKRTGSVGSNGQPEKRKRMKLTFKGPEPTVTHPSQVINKDYSSLDDFLNSFKSFLDDDVSIGEYEEKVQEEIELVRKLRNAFENQIISFVPHTNKIVKATKPKTFVDPFSIIPTYNDHLVAQGTFLSKSLKDGQKARAARIRKLNFMIENHFRLKSGEKDREKKEHERNMKKLARNTVTMVKKRWREVEKAHKIIVDKQRELEKIEEGKKTMNKMVLDSSLRAVGHAINGKQEGEDENEDEEDEEGMEDDDVDEISDVDLSEKEDGEEALTRELIEKDDSELTQEELRKKYAFLENYKVEGDTKVADDKETDDSDFEEDKSDSSNDIMRLTEEDKKRFSQIQTQQKEHDSLLDSDEPLSSSEEESQNESESDEGEEEESEDEGVGLASLFGASIEQRTLPEIKEFDDGEEIEVDQKENDEIYEEKVEEKVEEMAESKVEAKVEEPEKHEEVNFEMKDGKQTSTETADESATIPDVPTPPLLRGKLRVYQKQGLNWLANLYNNNTNGILADEMGLGKTIQTISLICYLACEKENWGPHLIVVPTSVIMNWEMEFKKFAPGFKVLTYYGNPQQRKEKRKGWNKPNTFHVCITSYQLVIHDHQSFRRRKWEYMILDEAHNIKNFRTARWQALLNFNTNRRLLLTGTPLQNNLAELWSLLYFLMPSSKGNSTMPEGFASLDDFQQWFGRPVDKIVEGGGSEQDKETKETINKLHKVLRPYLLRRLKADVETQMPLKYEHILYCRLSKRQRFLYDDFMSRAQTKETLASGNFLSIINCLMQLRKVCNHPDLFEVRPIITSLAIDNCISGVYQKTLPKNLSSILQKEINLDILGYIFTKNDISMTTTNANSIQRLNARAHLVKDCVKLEGILNRPVKANFNDIKKYYEYFKYQEQKKAYDHSQHIVYINEARCQQRPVFGENLFKLLRVDNFFNNNNYYLKRNQHILDDMIKPLETRMLSGKNVIEKYGFVTPSIVTLDQKHQSIPDEIVEEMLEADPEIMSRNSLHQAQMKLSIQFPDKSLLLYDSGKLQTLAKLLARLKSEGHRALIFTQMTKVLDILEKFLNSLGYLYMRLDGATKIEDRQLLTEKFNRDSRITCFILSTRSGGLGINLTGADTVIFYDNDWNPAMDKQCQDRCHRIGQTRDVHIYRFVSEFTIEENIMRKSNYKRKLDNVVIQDGDFTTDYFGKLTLSDILGTEASDGDKLLLANGNVDSLAQAEDAEDAAAAKEAIKESNLDDEDFDEEEKQDTVKEDEEDDGIGHIDEYMLRFIEGGYYY